jgi:hypothetical protein
MPGSNNQLNLGDGSQAEKLGIMVFTIVPNLGLQRLGQSASSQTHCCSLFSPPLSIPSQKSESAAGDLNTGRFDPTPQQKA